MKQSSTTDKKTNRVGKRRENAVELLGVAVDNIMPDEFFGKIKELLKRDKKSLVTYVNVHTMNIAAYDQRLKQIYARSDLTYCDGAGVVWGARLLGLPLKKRMTSATFIFDLCKRWEKDGTRLYFLGGEPEVAGEAARALVESFPSLNIVGYHHGFFKKNSGEETEIFKNIREAAPDILFVGFGTPIQEYWSDSNFDNLQAKVIWPIGALVDYLSGRVPRCPTWIQDHSLEWAYRFAIEPRRLFKRYIIGNPRFMTRILREKFKNRLQM